MKNVVLLMFLLLVMSCGKKSDDSSINEKAASAHVTVEEKVDTVTIVPSSYLYRYDSELSDKSVGEYWSIYKRVRAVAKELTQNEEYLKANDSLLLAAECMIKVKESGIASWQFNNAGKNCIDKFMKEAKYQEKVSLLNGMEPGSEKSKTIKDVQSVYKEHMAILQWGKLYLEKAYDCNEDEFEKKREKAISNNLAFIEEIEKFMKI